MLIGVDHFSLLRLSGKSSEALGYLADLVMGGAEVSEALLLAGSELCLERGDICQASWYVELLLLKDPSSPYYLSKRASCLCRAGDVEGAICLLLKVSEDNPGLSFVLGELGFVYESSGQRELAKKSYIKALDLEPSMPQALSNLAALVIRDGDCQWGVELCERCLSVSPLFAEAHANIGAALIALGRRERALRHLLVAVRLKRSLVTAQYCLGRLYQDGGDFTRAVFCYSCALQVDSAYHDSRLSRSFCLLALGRYASGWEEYESRGRMGDGGRLLVASSLPMWDGTSLELGAPLLVIAEQGIGDTLQFVRFVDGLVQLGVDVTLCAHAALLNLLACSGVRARLCAPEEAVHLAPSPWLPLLSLPRVLGLRLEKLQGFTPYVTPPREAVERWRVAFAAERRPLIAINWQGNPAAEIENLKGRSLPLEQFAPLAATFPGTFVSLQKGAGSEQLEACSFRSRFVASQAEVDASVDFVESAAVIANCDLVISSDTAVAHLAGAMGVPVWVLLHHSPDWRWGAAGSECPWYPSMRLFRQGERGDWQTVMERVSAVLMAEGVPVKGLPSPVANRSESLLAPLRRRWHRFWDWVAFSSGDPEALDQAPYIQQADAIGLAWSPKRRMQRQEEIAYALFQDGLLPESRQAYLALAEQPGCSPRVFGALGALALLDRDDDTALRWLTRALDLDPDSAGTWSNLGLVKSRSGDDPEAMEAFRRAVEIDPTAVEAICGVGCMLVRQGRLADAMEAFDRALALDPQHVESRWNRATTLLLGGDYSSGFEEFEWRLRDQRSEKLHASPLSPRWTGPGDGHQPGHLLIVGEQGLGDVLQFARFVQHCAVPSRQLRLCAPPALHGLLQASGIPASLCTPQEAYIAGEDAWVPLLSLPHVLQLPPQAITGGTPYLVAPPERIVHWREVLGSAAGPRPVLALNWQGNPQAELHGLRGRSFPLEALAPLAASTEMALVSLQKGFGAEQWPACSFRDRFLPCQDAVDQAWDFQETAALLAATDLLITSDTALAHLAGAMGHPTWLLLHHSPDWRWGQEGDTTPWYPSMRLFRQRHPGDWDELIARVAAALPAFLADRTTGAACP